MRKFELLVGAAVVAALVLAAIAFPPLLASEPKVGFEATKLVRPSALSAPPADIRLPGPNASKDPGYNLSKIGLKWKMGEDVYAGYGGALVLRVTNALPCGSLFVYGLGLQWASEEAFARNCSVIIPPGEEVEAGLLLFGAPSLVNSGRYNISISFAASTEGGSEWYDYRTRYWDGPSEPIALKPLPSAGDCTVTSNPSNYYGRVNERIDLGAVASIVSEVRETRPGGYSVLQIAQAFQWVKDHITYLEDGAEDYWQTAAETVARGTGDCEDQSLLLASIVTGLGGNARVNIIYGHAFPTVFVGTAVGELAEVKRALASFYGLDASEYRMAYLQDDLGYWAVIDTSGFQYAGGIPAMSAPNSADGTWSVRSPYLYPVDVVASAAEDRGGWPF